MLKIHACKERGNSSGLYAEPVNTLSNIAFFAAAFITLPFCKGWVDGVLGTGCILVGLGSMMYHAMPSRLTQMWDITSIVSWCSFYVFVWAHFMMGLTVPWSIGAITVLLIASALFLRKYGGCIHGNSDYVPVIVLLLLCGTLELYKNGFGQILWAGILAAIALVFRVIDNEVKLTSGTHFLWHILNGFMMAMLTMFVTMHVRF